MRLHEQTRHVELTLSNLRQEAAEADGWIDEKRREFDANRLAPLTLAGQRLLSALRLAEQQYEEASRLMPDLQPGQR